MKGTGRILIVDDEPLVHEMLRNVLSMSHEVATAAGGTDALRIAPLFQPDVILTDMTMPGMSGPDLLDALRRAGVTVPVILMPGKPITTPEGFFALLQKPFDLRQPGRGRDGSPPPRPERTRLTTGRASPSRRCAISYRSLPGASELRLRDKWAATSK